MGHKNNFKISKHTISDKLYEIIYIMIESNKSPILLQFIENNLNFNSSKIYFYKYKNANNFIKKEHTNILNFLKKNDKFIFIHKNANIYIDIRDPWVHVDNPDKNIIIQ